MECVFSIIIHGARIFEGKKNEKYGILPFRATSMRLIKWKQIPEYSLLKMVYKAKWNNKRLTFS